MQRPFASLVLATVGRAAELQPLLDSLIAQTDRDFELIVVDQNGDDRLEPVLQTITDAGIPLLHLRQSRPNLALARNAGIERARGQMVGFPDDDCWYDAELIARLRTAADGVDGVIGHWVEELGPAQRDQGRLLDPRRWRRFRADTDISSITLFLKADLLARIGGFDPRLGVGCWYGAGEETDLVLRALAAGARLLYSPTVQVHHAAQKLAAFSLAGCRSQRRRARGTGGVLAKHRFAPPVVLRSLLGAPIRLWMRNTARPDAFVQGLFVSLGRLEGYLRWRLREQPFAEPTPADPRRAG